VPRHPQPTHADSKGGGRSVLTVGQEGFLVEGPGKPSRGPTGDDQRRSSTGTSGARFFPLRTTNQAYDPSTTHVTAQPVRTYPAWLTWHLPVSGLSPPVF
jgi:hypothetical protein